MQLPLNLTRSILTILLPGGIAVAPWLLLIVRQWPNLGSFYSDNPIFANGVLFGVVVVVGKIFETLGSSVEVKWDEEREDTYSVRENWFVYLARSVDPEPVGYRYINHMVITFYFELTMSYAVFFLFSGSTVLVLVSEIALWPIAAILFFFAIGTRDYFYKQARDSHKVLCEVRKELNKRLDSPSPPLPFQSPLRLRGGGRQKDKNVDSW